MREKAGLLVGETVVQRSRELGDHRGSHFRGRDDAGQPPRPVQRTEKFNHVY